MTDGKFGPTLLQSVSNDAYVSFVVLSNVSFGLSYSFTSPDVIF